MVVVGVFAWSALGFVMVVVGSIWHMAAPWPLAWWSNFWLVAGIIAPMVVVAVTGVWFTLGGVRDIRVFFQRLRTLQRDAHDDGTVERR